MTYLEYTPVDSRIVLPDMEKMFDAYEDRNANFLRRLEKIKITSNLVS